MNSEKVKEIKECLQSCNDDKIACYDCKYYEKCEKILTKNNILTLINELESKKENLYDLNQNLISDRQALMSENEILKKDYADIIDNYKFLVEENERLWKTIQSIRECLMIRR